MYLNTLADTPNRMTDRIMIIIGIIPLCEEFKKNVDKNKADAPIMLILLLTNP